MASIKETTAVTLVGIADLDTSKMLDQTILVPDSSRGYLAKSNNGEERLLHRARAFTAYLNEQAGRNRYLVITRDHDGGYRRPALMVDPLRGEFSKFLLTDAGAEFIKESSAASLGRDTRITYTARGTWCIVGLSTGHVENVVSSIGLNVTQETFNLVLGHIKDHYAQTIPADMMAAIEWPSDRHLVPMTPPPGSDSDDFDDEDDEDEEDWDDDDEDGNLSI